MFERPKHFQLQKLLLEGRCLSNFNLLTELYEFLKLGAQNNYSTAVATRNIVQARFLREPMLSIR